MRASKELVLASNNYDKLLEFQELLKDYPWIRLIPAKEVIRNSNKLDSVEVHPGYLENAIAKARLANQGVHFPCLADDSGLEIDALRGAPGVKTRRYSIPKAGQTQDASNIEKVLSELRGVPMDKRTARFVCHLALVMEGIMITASGTLEGFIAEAPTGKNGFGYDPIFVPKLDTASNSATLAEMDADKKNQISHRAMALLNLMTEIKKMGLILSKP